MDDKTHRIVTDVLANEPVIPGESDPGEAQPFNFLIRNNRPRHPPERLTYGSGFVQKPGGGRRRQRGGAKNKRYAAHLIAGVLLIFLGGATGYASFLVASNGTTILEMLAYLQPCTEAQLLRLTWMGPMAGQTCVQREELINRLLNRLAQMFVGAGVGTYITWPQLIGAYAKIVDSIEYCITRGTPDPAIVPVAQQKEVVDEVKNAAAALVQLCGVPQQPGGGRKMNSIKSGTRRKRTKRKY